MRIRRRRDQLAVPATSAAPNVYAGEARDRLQEIIGGPLTEPQLVASIDQLVLALRHRFSECGVDLADPEVRAVLFVALDTLMASASQVAQRCPHAAAMWSIGAQMSAALLTIDTWERTR